MTEVQANTVSSLHLGGSDLKHGARQTAGSGSVKLDRQDALEIPCQGQILYFVAIELCQP